MNKVIVILELTDTGYSAYVPELPITCTAGVDLNEIEVNMREAIALHLEGMQLYKEEIPIKFKANFIFDFHLDIQDFFQLFKPVKQSVIAKRAGINPSLLRQYARGIKHPSLAQTKKIEKAIHQLGRELLKVQLL